MYTDFYGLKAEPFLLTPDHRFYFDSQVHRQAMAHLMYGINRGEGFIVITGEVGAGKTTTVQRLCATVDRGHFLAASIVTTLLTGSELLRMVCAGFGMVNIPQEKDAVLRSLRAFLEQTGRAGHRALLIIDEAQNLSVSALEELRMLSNFQLGNISPCQIFLVGQPQFRKVLAHPDLEQLRQRVIASYHMGALSPVECGHYVLHRMKQVNWVNDPVFQDDALSAVFTHTGGIPRRINTLCSRLLLLGYLDNLHTFTGEDVARVAADLQAEIGDVSVPKGGGDYLGGANGTKTGLSTRVEALERRVELLRRITTSLTELQLGPGRSDGS